MFSLKAAENIRTGDYVYHSDDWQSLMMATPERTRYAIGIAARNIAQGEIVEYAPNNNTADIVASTENGKG